MIMSLWLLRRLSRCNLPSLEQCISIPQNINCKLSSQLWQSSKKQSQQFSTIISTCNGTLLQSVPGAKYHQALSEPCRYLSVTCSAQLRGPQNTTNPPGEEQTKDTDNREAIDGSSPRERNIKSLLEDSADPTVTPGPEGKRMLLWEQGPYPKNSNYQQSQAKFSYRPNVDPSTTSIVLFPGQGTQFIGMGKNLLSMPSVQEMYDVASEILGFDLKNASLNGPEKFLSRTQVQQPAILVASLAAVERLREDNPQALENCVATAGFSVGEITALTFAGALSFEDAVRLIKVRAEAMQLASEMIPGGMMTAFFNASCRLSLCCATAKEFCAKKGVENAECKVASYLWPTCKVVAGSEEALQFLKENMADFHLKRLKRLNVSGAFHTEHMKPAAEALKEALRYMTINTPNIPVHSNIDGKPYRNPEQIRRNLPKQIHTSVKWEQTLHTIYERPPGVKFPRTYECGPGQSLRSILKMNNRKAMDNMENIVA